LPASAAPAGSQEDSRPNVIPGFLMRWPGDGSVASAGDEMECGVARNAAGRRSGTGNAPRFGIRLGEKSPLLSWFAQWPPNAQSAEWAQYGDLRLAATCRDQSRRGEESLVASGCHASAVP
jgi:hypothetical protein